MRLWFIVGLLSAAGSVGCESQLLSGGGTGSDGGGGGGGDASGEVDLAVGQPCGDVTCAVGEVCDLGTCHRDCGGKLRCGLSKAETCCAAGDICYLGACTTPGMACGGGGGDGGVCGSSRCPDKQYCEPSINKCLPLAMTGLCEYHPPVGAFSPKVKWEWQGSQILPAWNQIMMAPMVADIDGDCMPDVVFSTFAAGDYTKNGVLRAVRGDKGQELWTVTDAALRVIGGAQIALADVDGDGKVEIFACHESRALIAFNFDGTKRWISTDLPCSGFDAPSVANVDHLGAPEVVVGFSVHNALTGVRIGTPPAVDTYGDYGAYTVPVELDGNVANGMEIAAGNVVYHHDCTLYWNHMAGVASYPAIGDLDGDGKPDVVSVDALNHAVSAYAHDGARMWGPVDVNNGVATPKGPAGGGPPTLADFNGDGKPDVATAGGYGYLVLNGQTGKVLWQSTMTTDTSSRVTGSSVFDFEGDGAAEAIYNDEHNLRVYDGATGKVRVKLCSTSGTLWEYPVIVDVDGDDHAEIVVMDNNYAINTCDQDTGGGPSHTGFKVIGDAMNRWVRTRRIWNQHTYHVSNVGDDARIPIDEATNWTQPGLNNFRQNIQTKNVFVAPDLVPRDFTALTDHCGDGVLTLVATVLNQGESVASAGVPVTFYQLTNNMTLPLGVTMTKGPLLPGGAETVSFDWKLPMGGSRGPFHFVVVVDENGKPMTGIVNECDETNNASLPISLGCPQIG